MAEVQRLVVDAERLGYSHVTCSEHVAIPREVAAVRGSTYWDPLAVFGYLSAHTSRIRFATFVLVLGYHHPLEIAKRYGTLDVVSDGRVVLGVGVGSLREDSFDGFVVDPCAVQRDVPIWIGGRTARSLRRAVELADGWAPFGLTVAEMDTMLGRARATEAWAARSTPLDVVLQHDRPLDPLGDPDGTYEAVSTVRAAGATTLLARFVHHSLDHYCEQLAALVPLVPD